MTKQQPEQTALPQTANQVVLDAKLLRQTMSAAADKHDPRDYLRGIYLDAANKCVIATNGHVVVKYDMPDMALTQSAIIKKFKAHKKAQYVRINLDHDAKTANAESFLAAKEKSRLLLIQPLDVFRDITYPRWEKAFIEKAVGEITLPDGTIGLTPRVLNCLAKCFTQKGDENYAVKIEFRGRENVLTASSERYPNLTLLANPARYWV